MSDITDAIDDYCESNYGHTNWGYASTYTAEELAELEEQYGIAERGDIIIFETDDEEDECEGEDSAEYPTHYILGSQLRKDSDE